MSDSSKNKLVELLIDLPVGRKTKPFKVEINNTFSLEGEVICVNEIGVQEYYQIQLYNDDDPHAVLTFNRGNGREEFDGITVENGKSINLIVLYK